jgi:tetratricopeptide (TPR) repeat protein
LSDTAELKNNQDTPTDDDLKKAVICHRNHEFDKAKQLYQKILEKEPGHDGVLYRLGVLEAQKGNYSKAKDFISEALKISPENIDYKNGLAGTYMQMRQFDTAIKLFYEILDERPDHADTHSNLGILLVRIGDVKNAKIHFKKAIEINPEHHEAYRNYGRVLHEEFNLDQAQKCFEKAVAIKPDYADAYYLLADTLKSKGRFTDAEENYREAVKHNPRLVHGWVNLGTMALLRNQVDYANDCYKKAMEVNPKDVTAYIHYSYLLDSTSNFKALDELIKFAQEHIPDEPVTYYMAGRKMRREGDFDGAKSVIEKYAQTDGLIGMKVNYELGLIYDKKKDSDQAFKHYKRANDMYWEQRNVEAIDKDAIFKQLDYVDKILTKEWVSSWTPPVENKNYNTPAFLVGFPRSGTTLLDQILNSHPEIFVSPERSVIGDAIAASGTELSNYPQFLAGMTPEQIEKTREIYFETHKSFGDWEDKKVFIDKAPLNMNILDIDYRVFPETKIILALRHPLDCVLSSFMYEFTPSKTMIQTASLERCAKLYDRSMHLFKRFTQTFPIEFHIIKYENLIEDIQEELTPLLEFLDLEWDENVLDYANTAKNRDFIATPSYSQVTKKLYKSARYRWVRYREHLEPIIPVLKPWIDEWGYSLDV